MTSALLMGIDKIPDQTGYFVLTHDGTVLASSGDLENDERIAQLIASIIQHACKIPLSEDGEQKFKRVSITYKDFVVMVTVSNQKIFVVKRPLETS